MMAASRPSSHILEDADVVKLKNFDVPSTFTDLYGYNPNMLEAPENESNSKVSATTLNAEDENNGGLGTSSVFSNAGQEATNKSHTPITPLNHEAESGDRSKLRNNPFDTEFEPNTELEPNNEARTSATSIHYNPELNNEAGSSALGLNVALSDKTRSPTTMMGLGNSILKPHGVQAAIEREKLLNEQRELAKVYAKSLPVKNAQNRSPILAPALPVENPFDIDVEQKKLRLAYTNKTRTQTLTPREEMEFINKETAYQKKIKDQAQHDGEASGEEELFVGQSTASRRKKPESKIPSRKRKVTDDDDESEVESRKPTKRGRGPGKKTLKTKLAITKPSRSKKGKKKAQGPGNRPENLATSNIINDAGAADMMHESTTFDLSEAKGRRDLALKALVKNAPEDQRKFAQADKIRLLNALKQFNSQGSVRVAEDSKWLVKGMKTSLTAHQVLGAAFMRARENSETGPRGGILADQMGLGKTLVSLANKVNGRGNGPWDDNEPHTTLVVVPKALLEQWRAEITKHCHGFKRTNQRAWGIGPVLVYRESDNTEMDPDNFGLYDIVLTTYYEVTASWPVMDMPENVIDDEEKLEWFTKNIWGKRGILHKFNWHRVCIDEAHEIRNPVTRQFRACRSLTATHRWAITGTPMVNGSWDLFALFDFIQHPDVKYKGLADFKKRFVKKDDNLSVEGLTEDLAECMTRFSHRDVLFGARLINLPKASAKVTQLHFTKIEFAIYDIVRRRFQRRIQKISDDGKLRTQTAHILTLVLRLRQLTAHPLMIQGPICACLEREDFEELQEIANSQAWVPGDGSHIIANLRKILAQQQTPAPLEGAAPVCPDGIDEETSVEAPAQVVRDDANSAINQGGSHGKHMRFGKYLDAIKRSSTWARMNDTMTCTVCAQPPDTPWITDCKHVYCKLCLDDMIHAAAMKGVDTAPCASCGHAMSAEPLEEVGPRDDLNPARDEDAPMPPKPDDMDNWLDLKGEVLPSTKTIAAKTQILNWLDPLYGGDPTNKIIIYTQWLNMVKVLSKVCETERWGHTTLGGHLTPKARTKNIKDFQDNETTKILISTLKCGGVGLNLTAASRVIMIDPWWNEAVEQQAFGRVYRIGQSRETPITNLRIKDSIDDRIFDLKLTKRVEIEKVMASHKVTNK